MEIRYAKQTDIPQLKHIWKVCFGDEDDYINFFFYHLFQPERTVVAVCRNTVIGVVYMLKASLFAAEFMYGYAIGVLPEYRGNSVCKTMLDYIRCEAAEQSFLFGLHPANEKLFSFYKKIGLTELYRLKTVDASEFCEETHADLYDVDASTYFSFRERAFAPLVSWDEKMLLYMLKEAKYTGGFAKRIIVQGQERILLAKVYHDTVFVKETTMTDDEIKATSHFLRRTFQAEKIVYTLPAASALNGETKTFVLGFETGQPNNIYMNLFLD